MMTQLNLDQQAARHAQEIVKECVKMKDAKAVENLITKALGVLQEQGVYAMMLFLFSRGSDEADIAPKLRQPLYRLLQQLPQYQNDQELAGFNERTEANVVLRFYADRVCGELDTLLLVKELDEQALIYARYGAKAERQP
jgi:hypothetical protein